MFSPGSFMLLATALTAVFSTQPARAAPAPVAQTSADTAASSNYWLANIKRQGTVWGNDNGTDYSVFRNVVTDFQADNTGQQDATEAINNAISAGGRCGKGCNSSTIHPAIVYFPPGRYLVSKPLVMFYYTQMVGDAVDIPEIVMASNFEGMGMLDSDPYEPITGNWYINQNNFFRQVRNFKMDLTSGPPAGSAMHWQVAQATSLQNIEFNMIKGSQQQGIFMDNGSGGWMSDLKFIGGRIGAFLGSQQFTSRNLEFVDCSTAIVMNWDWGWVLNNITITGSEVGIDMANSPANMSTGSIMLSDSTISDTKYGVNTSYAVGTNLPLTGNTLVIDNTDMEGTTLAAVWSHKEQKPVVEPRFIDTWAQGSGFTQSAQSTSANGSVGEITQPHKDPSLLASDGKIYGRSKPQYENVPLENFLSAKDNGCVGDGETDDTAAVQAFLDKAAAQDGAIAYFDHGAYLISDTITVPNKLKMTGEIWPLMVADGSAFNDVDNPKPFFRIGEPGSKGTVEISDIIFETKGPAPGAVMIEWNMDSPKENPAGMWDSHVRIGGSANTQLSEAQCPGTPTTEPTPECQGVFLMFHATKDSGGLVIENDWFWVADHDLEVNNQTQISIYSGRGALIQSKGPVWLWGSASEHSIIYNYQFDGAQAVFGGFMQSETPYFQPAPLVPTPFSFNAAYDDPTFTVCPDGSDANDVPCKDAWGLRIVNSRNILIYATGFYSFFNNYSQVCTPLGNCQEYMIRIQNSQVDMYTVTTKAAVNMILDDRVGSPIVAAPNHNVFGDTIAWYSSGGASSDSSPQSSPPTSSSPS